MQSKLWHQASWQLNHAVTDALTQAQSSVLVVKVSGMFIWNANFNNMILHLKRVIFPWLRALMSFMRYVNTQLHVPKFNSYPRAFHISLLPHPWLAMTAVGLDSEASFSSRAREVGMSADLLTAFNTANSLSAWPNRWSTVVWCNRSFNRTQGYSRWKDPHS